MLGSSGIRRAQAARVGWDLLQAGASALDAVEADKVIIATFTKSSCQVYLPLVMREP